MHEWNSEGFASVLLFDYYYTDGIYGLNVKN